MNYLLNDLSQKKFFKSYKIFGSQFQINIIGCIDVTQNEIFQFNLKLFLFVKTGKMPVSFGTQKCHQIAQLV